MSKVRNGSIAGIDRTIATDGRPGTRRPLAVEPVNISCRVAVSVAAFLVSKTRTDIGKQRPRANDPVSETRKYKQYQRVCIEVRTFNLGVVGSSPTGPTRITH